MKASAEFRATILVALSAILYGFLGYFGTHLLNEHLSLASMLFWRFFIAGLWILATTFNLQKNKVFAYFKQGASLAVLLWGTVLYCIGSLFYFLACQRLGTGLAMVIFFTYPIFVALLVWLVGKAPISQYTIGCLIAICIGVFLLNPPGHTLNLLGLIFAIIAAFAYALYIFSSRRITLQIPSSTVTMLISFGCASIFLIMAYLEHGLQIPHSANAWAYACALGIIATALPIQLLLEGLKVIQAIKASILSVLEPVVTLVIGIMLLNEFLSFTQAIGVLIILGAAIFIQFE
jgi:drug/metabolite transporter (DMT)-like permease